MTSPICPFARLEEERQIRIQSRHPNGAPKKIYLMRDLRIQDLWCQHSTLASLYPSGNIEVATLAASRIFTQRRSYESFHLPVMVCLPVKTTVICKDDPSNPIIGYQLTKMTSIQGIPCAKETPVYFDEQGYLSRATLAKGLWLPGKLPLNAGEEINLQNGKIIEPPPSSDAEVLWRSFLN